MPIPTYFMQIDRILQGYTKTGFLVDSKIDFAHRIGSQGFLKGSVEFIDHSVLYFKERKLYHEYIEKKAKRA
jgi:hypothetical protein